MIIGSDELLRLVKNKNLIQNLCDRELQNPEGPGFDLRAGEFYQITGKGFLGINKRKTTDIKKKSFKINKKNNKQRTIIIKPGDYYLVVTIEKLCMDNNIFAQVFPRSTLFRSGIQLLSGKISPGYFGKLTFGLANLGPASFEIELGARVAFIVFHKVQGRSNLSRGQWKGGRIAARKIEEQV